MTEPCVARNHNQYSVVYGSPLCGKPGKVQDKGNWHCGIHSQAAKDRVEARRQVRHQEWRNQQNQHETNYVKLAYDRAAGDLCRELGLDKDELTLDGLSKRMHGVS